MVVQIKSLLSLELIVQKSIPVFVKKNGTVHQCNYEKQLLADYFLPASQHDHHVKFQYRNKPG